MNYLSIDIGTTGCKCQLFSQNGEILSYLLREYDFKKIDGEDYVDVEAIWFHVRNMISEISAKNTISSICISSLGESFVMLDEKDDILFYPMIYTDPRGENEAEIIKKTIGEDKAFEITGVIPHSMYSLSKILYIKNEHPQIFAKAQKIMLICDYIGYLLTGERVIDHGLASRTACFDIRKKEFSTEILEAFNIPRSLFSRPEQAGTVVGKIKEEWGIDGLLVLGSHDQICAALGAGVLKEGDAVDGMGTVECITTLFKDGKVNAEMGRQGYPCVPYPVDGVYCTYILNYSCGSTINWLRKKIMHNYKGEEKDFYTYIEKDMSGEPTGILTLPYFSGAGTPYQNLSARGAIVNLDTETRDCDLYKSVMEGMAFEMRLNGEVLGEYGITVNNAVATGGGANSKKWLRIKADIQNIPIRTLRSSEGGLCGCAMLQAVALGQVGDLTEGGKIFVRYEEDYEPDKESHNKYEQFYQKYKQIYIRLKEVF